VLSVLNSRQEKKGVCAGQRPQEIRKEGLGLVLSVLRPR